MDLAELLVKLMCGEPLTQEEIKFIKEDSVSLLERARTMEHLAKARFALLKTSCKHPNYVGYVCPDCGLDDSPDGY